MSLTESTEEVNGRGWWRETTPVQIQNLLDKGKSAEQIAEVLGVTIGTLKVTCSKKHVSLRRPPEFRVRQKSKVDEPQQKEVKEVTVQSVTIQSDNGLQKILTLEAELRAKADEHITAAEIIKVQLVGVAMARKALE